MDSQQDKVDLYRDTPVRLLGYANEVGEAFRAIIGAKLVWCSYGIATAYGLADTIDKSMGMYRKTSADDSRTMKTLFSATDTFLWQMLASVAIPGFTINRICALTMHVVRKRAQLPPTVATWIVPAVGLTTIPFIVRPIDRVTDLILDRTFRQFTPRTD